MLNSEHLIKIHRNRANIIANIILLAYSLLLARLWFLQVYKGKLLLNYSLKNRLRREVVEAPRGMFFARDNQLIVDNVPRFDAVITPQYLSNKKVTISNLAVILNLTDEQIYKTLKKNSTLPSYRPIIIKKNISMEEVAKIETENAELLGVSVETSITREYKDKEVGAHILGHTTEISSSQLPKFRNRDQYDYKLGDFIGQSGLEEELDLFIRGVNGSEYVEVDALGRKKRHLLDQEIFKGIENKPSIPGNNVKLTIDRDMQLVAYEALINQVGSVVALEVNTGQVLTVVSRPSYNPSNFGRGLTTEYWQSLLKDPFNPFRNRAIQEHYSPGSTYKTIVAVSALEEGIVDEHTEVLCTGKFRLGTRTFHCWKKEGHGSVNIYRSLRESCDIYFYKIATKLDIDVLSKYAHMFGLGHLSGINIPREIPGLVPTKEWKKKRNGESWALGETLSCAIGQSYMLTTPLQLTLAYASIANGGTLYRPYLVQELFNNKGEVIKKWNPEVRHTFKLKDKTSEIIRDALYQVVNVPSGTAYSKRGKGILMAGKTGTSQVVRFSADKIFSKCEEFEYKFRHHAVFVAFAPYDNPKVAVGALVEHGCHGSSAAGPIVEAVITTYMKKYQPKLYAENIEKELKLAQLTKQKLSQKVKLAPKVELIENSTNTTKEILLQNPNIEVLSPTQ
jgi:penicillin-binding protein 2